MSYIIADRELALLRTQYSHTAKRNRNKGFILIMTCEEFCLMIKQPCHYCGLPHSKTIPDRQSQAHEGKVSMHILKCNGVDRIDSEQGYTLENTLPSCKICNNAKNVLSTDEFLQWVDRIYEFNHSVRGS